MMRYKDAMIELRDNRRYDSFDAYNMYHYVAFIGSVKTLLELWNR